MPDDDPSDVDSLYDESAPFEGPATEPDDTRSGESQAREERYDNLLLQSEKQANDITHLRESLVKLQSAHDELTEGLNLVFDGGRNLSWTSLTDSVASLKENHGSLFASVNALNETARLTQAHESRIGGLEGVHAAHNFRLNDHDNRLSDIDSRMSKAGSALCGLTDF